MRKPLRKHIGRFDSNSRERGANLRKLGSSIRPLVFGQIYFGRLTKSTLSSFFEDLFSLPQPADDEFVDSLPVVQLSEDVSLLSNFVSLLYRPQRPA
jgi:hypothetical protein